MDFGMIGKIEKAMRYAAEKNRIHFEVFAVTMDGENNPQPKKSAPPSNLHRPPQR